MSSQFLSIESIKTGLVGLSRMELYAFSVFFVFLR